MKSVAPLIAIEGADRLGKQTQTELLLSQLRSHGHNPCSEEVPWKGHTATYDTLYAMLGDGSASKFPVVFQTIQGINRREMLRSYLPGKQEQHDVVLLDRWTPSTWVYGNVSGVTADQTRAILHNVPDPDLTIVLHGESFAMDKEKDAYEANTEFQKTVNLQYQAWAEANNAPLVNANRDKDEVAAEIWGIVSGFLG